MSLRWSALLVELAARVITKASAPIWIALGLFIWALVLAIGAYLFNHHWGRFAFVFGCTTAFVVFWAIMLDARKRRLAREAADEQEFDSPSSDGTIGR
jgi:hypothetical protein